MAIIGGTLGIVAAVKGRLVAESARLLIYGCTSEIQREIIAKRWGL